VTALLLAGLVAGEAGVALALWHGAWAEALALHLPLAALPAVALHRGWSAAPWLRVLAPLLPPLGPLAAALALPLAALLALRGRPAAGAASWSAHLFPQPESDALAQRAEGLARHAAQHDPDGIGAFRAVLHGGTLAQQEHVLAVMAREFRTGFAPLLREALASPAPGLRAQAAAGLSLAQGRAEEQLQALRRAGEPAPVLARALDDAANSGLFEADRAAQLRAEAVRLWQRHLAARPDDAAAQAALGRDLLALGDAGAAQASLRQALARGLATPAVLGWLAEALYAAGDLDAVAALLAEHRAVLAEPGAALAGPVAWWLAEQPA
jgi:DUF971 family protein